MACKSDDEKEVWVIIFWNIENYSYTLFDGIQSPVFRVDSIENTLWKLVVCHNGDTLSYYLSGSRVQGSKIIEFEYDLAILAEDGSILQKHQREKMELRNKYTEGTESLLLPDDLKTTTREAFLSRDTLRFRCRLWRTDGKPVTPVTFFARTASRVETRNFLWDVKRFSSLGSRQDYIYIISSDSKKEFIIFNIGVPEENKVTIGIKSLNEKETFMKFQSFITDINGSRTDCGNCEVTLNENEEYVRTLPFTKTHLMDNKKKYLKNDVLSLYCKCSWSDGYDVDRIERIDYGIACTSTRTIPKPCTDAATDSMVDLKEDLESLYTKSILSDVKLRTTTKTFEAHKNILSARSPVFHAMFITDLEEEMPEIEEISDLEDDIVQRMLLYMYTNTLEGLEWESALKLYAAADQYEIEPLKRKCSSFLKCNLRPSNVCDVLVLTDIHSDGDLKETVQEYALAHEEEVFHSDEWRSFTETNPISASRTMLLKWNKL